MRKRVFGRQLSRGRGAREALFRSLIRALVISGKITTTKAKAKAVQRDVDKLVTLAKKSSLSAIRKISYYLGNERGLAQVFSGRIAKTFKERAGGYTRIILLPNRKGDSAQMARLEWTQEIIAEEKKEVPKKVEKKSKVTKKVKTK